jgi:hypothetical protein
MLFLLSYFWKVKGFGVCVCVLLEFELRTLILVGKFFTISASRPFCFSGVFVFFFLIYLFLVALGPYARWAGALIT